MALARVKPSFNRMCFGLDAPGIISFLPGFATLAHAGELKRYMAIPSGTE
jgi:hypothetical protein